MNQQKETYFQTLQKLVGRPIDKYIDLNQIENLKSIAHENIDRIQGNKEVFTVYEKLNEPVIIQNLTVDWEVSQNFYINIEKCWTVESLVENFTNDFKIGEDDEAKPIIINLKDFIEYSKHNKDKYPLYIFDRQRIIIYESDLTKLSREGKQMHEYYNVSEIFGFDLMSLLGSQRTQYRWLLLGPERSGSLGHIDPYQSSAWNTSLQGRKRWVLFPPFVQTQLVNGKFLIEQNLIQEIDLQSPISYFTKALPLILQIEDLKNINVVQCIQMPNETIFVPRGWWHAVINLDDTLAVTQNYINEINFPFAWKALRSENPRLASILLNRLSENLNTSNLSDLARQINKTDGFQMMFEFNKDQMDFNCLSDNEDILFEFDNKLYNQ